MGKKSWILVTLLCNPLWGHGWETVVAEQFYPSVYKSNNQPSALQLQADTGNGEQLAQEEIDFSQILPSSGCVA